MTMLLKLCTDCCALRFLSFTQVKNEHLSNVVLKRYSLVSDRRMARITHLYDFTQSAISQLFWVPSTVTDSLYRNPTK